MSHAPVRRSVVSAVPTVLLVEDNAAVRRWIHCNLEKFGYNLLEACDGVDALMIAELHCGRIDIVVTDVVMPRMDGPTLVKALLQLRPAARVLYISGYPAPFLERENVLPSDGQYLQKPFSMGELLQMMDALEAPAAFATGDGTRGSTA